MNDTELVGKKKQQVSELPSYGYRRVWGLLRSEREVHSLAPINVKRVYHAMRDHNLLLERRIKQPDVQGNDDEEPKIRSASVWLTVFARRSISTFPFTG